MKTHIKTFLLTVGFFAAVVLVAFAIYSWRLDGITFFLSAVFAFVYYTIYCIIRETEETNNAMDAWEEEEE